MKIQLRDHKYSFTGRRIELKVFDTITNETKKSDRNDKLGGDRLNALYIQKLEYGNRKPSAAELESDIEYKKMRRKRSSLKRQTSTFNDSMLSYNGIIEESFPENKEPEDLIDTVSIEAAREVVDFVAEKIADLNVTDFIMIGGYSDSPYLKDAMKSEFPLCKIHMVSEPVMLELKGAVIHGHDLSRYGRYLFKTKQY